MADRPGAPALRRSAAVALIAAAPIVTGASNAAAGVALRRFAPGSAWIATAAIPSCLAIVALYAALGDPRLLHRPRVGPARGRRAAALASGWLAVWLAGSALAAWRGGGWITYARGAPAILAFLLFGPIGEELLFRGLTWDAARRASGSARGATLLSAVAFSTHHLFLRPTPSHGMLAAQLAFTLPMGIVLVRLRRLTGSLWPSLLLHVATNMPAAIG